MATLLYVRLIGFTAGTLLMLFWMVVILGYRRQRNLERVFFFLCLALFLFYSGSLLAINAQIYYTQPSEALENFAGCAVVISHDRWFLDRLATHILAFEGDSHVEWFDGNYTEYEADRHARLGAAADRR